MQTNTESIKTGQVADYEKAGFSSARPLASKAHIDEKLAWVLPARLCTVLMSCRQGYG